MPRLRAKMPDPEMHNGDFDETSLGAAAVDLALHCQAVASRTRDIANNIGLSPDLIDVVERAGTLHDVGKADRRFKRWLDPAGQQGGARGQVECATPPVGGNANRLRMASGWPSRGPVRLG